MRIIGGRFRSRRLKAPAGLTVRPTPDRLREALFNVIAPELGGATFLDAYAGTGAVGFEALSRGARHVILFERDHAAMGVIRENITTLQVPSEVTAIRGQATKLLTLHTADIAFIDPPYDLVGEYAGSLLALSATACRLVIAQHPSRLVLADDYAALHRTRILRQGDNSLSFYWKSTSSSGADL